MSHPVGVIWFAVFLVVVVLLITVSSSVSGADDLSRGQSQGTAPMVIGNQSDARDDDRLARDFSHSTAIVDSTFPAILQVFSSFQCENNSPAGPRRLYQVNVVFLI
jgi:hypothetical protein